MHFVSHFIDANRTHVVGAEFCSQGLWGWGWGHCVHPNGLAWLGCLCAWILQKSATMTSYFPSGKESTCQSLVPEDPLEEGMATYSSMLA